MSIHWLRAVLLLVLLSSFSEAQSRAEQALKRDLQALEEVVYIVGLASGAALLVSLGLLVARWRMGTVRARRFVLRGDEGQPIAQLVQGPNGGGELELRDADGELTAVLGSGLKLCDRSGRVRADLRLESDKAPLLELYDERGEVRAGFSLSEDGAGSLAFYDETGRPRAGLGSGHAGAMRLSFFDKQGRMRLQSGIEDEEVPSFKLYDAQGEVRGALSVRAADGMTLLEMRDQDGHTRTIVGVLEEGIAWLGVLDEEQRFRAGLGAPTGGNPRLDFYDEDGETRASLRIDNQGRPKLDLD